MSIQELVQLEDYEQFVGPRTIERIRKKAKLLRHLHVVNINSAYSGGGVAQLLTSLTLLMNNSGIDTGWRIIHGSPDFFSITKKMHNALQGGQINLSARKMKIYESVIRENAVRNHLENHNMVITILGGSLIVFGTAGYAAKEMSGEELFKQHCAVCHPNGGNTVNPQKPLHKKEREANGVKTASDIVNKMRNPGPGMTKFDEKTISDGDAKKIAEYVLKTF